MADETLTAKHSPTPWKVCGAPQCKCGLVWSLPADMVVAIAQGPQHEEDAPTPTTEQQAANAAHIVASVNERDGLLAEIARLKQGVRQLLTFDGGEGSHSFDAAEVKAARALLIGLLNDKAGA